MLTFFSSKIFRIVLSLASTLELNPLIEKHLLSDSQYGQGMPGDLLILSECDIGNRQIQTAQCKGLMCFTYPEPSSSMTKKGNNVTGGRGREKGGRRTRGAAATDYKR